MSAMPGHMVTTAAAIACGHAGKVQDAPAQTRVLASGAPVATVLDQLIVTGCPGVSGSPPCTKVVWSGVASRVLAGGQAVLVQTTVPTGPVLGDGVCVGPAPTTPFVYAVQLRVRAG
ncbi:hypothetical protein [Streptomyces sp. NRRL S-448]|uniref:hypothetical protein n=1 Tax=Streptomyces sp. NRRL S-448 TaxID=1463907 RepID=UPI003561BC6A